MWGCGYDRHCGQEAGATAARQVGQAQQAPPAVTTLLIVGHDPGIPELALTLAGGTAPGGSDPRDGAVSPAVTDRMRIKFPTAAIAVLELTGPWDHLGPGAAWLTGFVTPRDVSASAG